MKKIKQSKNINNSIFECVFCLGTGIVKFIDMDKVPNNTNMLIGDSLWKKYEKIGKCPEGCEILN